LLAFPYYFEVSKMPKDVQFDPTDKGTLRPKAKPIRLKGDHFTPLECPPFNAFINLPPYVYPDDAFGIFKLFFLEDIMQQIAQYTNACARQPKDPTKPWSRAYTWKEDTTV
jgi:hypothetical protein